MTSHRKNFGYSKCKPLNTRKRLFIQMVNTFYDEFRLYVEKNGTLELKKQLDTLEEQFRTIKNQIDYIKYQKDEFNSKLKSNK